MDVLVAGLGAATWSTGQTPTTPATSRSWSASASVAVTVMPLNTLVNDPVRPTLSPSLPASLSTWSCEAFAGDGACHGLRAEREGERHGGGYRENAAEDACVHESFLGGLGLWGICDRASVSGNGLHNISDTVMQIPVGQAQVLGRLRGTIDPSTSTGGKGHA